MSALELSKAIKEKEIGVTDVVNAYLNVIEENNPTINAFLAMNKDGALKKAQEVQKKIDSGEALSPLAGVPIGIKDCISTKGIETTSASLMLKGFVPVYDATVMEKLDAADMIFMGKINMDEFAMGAANETSYYGPVHNPWDLSRVPGGSSGGSAAAVAAGLVPLALGSDTGGSIRLPCSFCGISGIKPTYGSVSRYGLFAFASSLDQLGPMGRSVEDCAALLSIMSGPDHRDSTCVIEKPFTFDGEPAQDLKGVVIGLPTNYFKYGIDDASREQIYNAAKKFEELGAKVEEFEMPYMDYMMHVYYIIGCAEASSNLARFDGLKYGYRSPKAKSLEEVYHLSRSEGFGMEVKRRIMLGSFVLSSGYFDSYYKKALQVRTLMKEEYDSLFKRFDMIMSPVSPNTAKKIGDTTIDPEKSYMGDVYNVSVNIAGLPSVAIPCGFDDNNMPVGLQLVGSAFSDEKLVKYANVYQKNTDFHNRRPSFYAGGELG